MKDYEILNSDGVVLARMVATEEMLASAYQGHTFREYVEPEPTSYVEPSVAVPPKRFILTRYEFRSLFTFNELIAITTASKTDVAIEVFMKSMEVAEQIDVRYVETCNGLAYLVANKFITQEKMDNILAGF